MYGTTNHPITLATTISFLHEAVETITANTRLMDSFFRH